MINIYLFQKDKYVLISDYPLSTIRRRFGHSFEILTNVKDKNNLDVIVERIKKTYPKIEFKTKFRTHIVFTDEMRNKIRQKKLGKARCEVFKNKMRIRFKGVSIFQGHKHKDDFKKFMSDKMKNNQINKGLYWVYNPITNQEKRIKDRTKIPQGFRLGRNHDSIEEGLYHLITHSSTKIPKERRSSKDL